MRVVVGIALAVVLVWAGDAHAAKKKKRHGASSALSVVVLPFAGKGAGGVDAKEAVELELELVDAVQVVASDSLENDLHGAGKRAFDAGTLAGLMQKRNVDVLVRGERGAGDRTPDALLVTAYGKDGLPRYAKELPLGSEPDVVAGTIVGELKPALEGWKTLKPLKPAAADDDDAGKGKVHIEDVLADGDKPPPPKKTDPPKKVTSTKSVLDEDDEPETNPKNAKPDAPKKGSASPLDFNSGDPADTERPKKHHGIDDDGAPEEKVHTEIDDSGRKHTIEDASDTEKPPEKEAKLGHTLAISGAFDGSTWYYGFDGNGVGDNQVNATFYPGGSASIDGWLGFFGVDAQLGVAAVPFKINGGEIAVTPSQFTSLQTSAEVALKLRYTLKNGIGLGVRGGYRYYGATVQPQTINVGGTTQNLTIVPGYTLHAGAVGVEVFLPIIIANHRLELEVKADGLPLTYYEEKPDNPGQSTLAFGWSASLAARYDIASGFFGELRGESTGATVTYSDQGSRLTLVGQQLKQEAGGSVLNLTAGFSAGVGFMF